MRSTAAPACPEICAIDIAVPPDTYCLGTGITAVCSKDGGCQTVAKHSHQLEVGSKAAALMFATQ